jgi:hypothetical protein
VHDLSNRLTLALASPVKSMSLASMFPRFIPAFKVQGGRIP